MDITLTPEADTNLTDAKVPDNIYTKRVEFFQECKKVSIFF